MSALLGIAARSAWNRRFVLSLIALSIALASFLLLAIERLRSDVRETFAQSVSGTDLIVGARTGSVQLLLYSVFRIGAATNNMRWSSAEKIAAHRAVAWTVPISLGDSHRGFPVVATTAAYFEHFRYGERQPLVLAEGRAFDALFDVVLGAEVASALGYRLGDRLVLSHGDGALAANDHTDKPFAVSGILARTGTPVDRSLHIGLDAMQALHESTTMFAPMSVTALLVGLKNRAAVFSVQRDVAQFDGEPLMAILPGVALDELWSAVGIGESALLATGALVALVSLAGLAATILAGLDERRRELAILRATGAAPRHVLLLLCLEGTLVTLVGVAFGALAFSAAAAMLGGWLQSQFGIALRGRWPSAAEWALLGAVLAAGVLTSLAPGVRAYRLSLADGLSPRI